MGGILSLFFLRHSEQILSENFDVAKETTREYLEGLLSDGELGALGPSVGAVLSEVPRAREPEDVRGRKRSRAKRK
jgi:hypothetical protein